MHPLRERWWIGSLQAGGDLRPLKKAGQATTVTCRADRNLHRHAIWCMLSSMKDVLWMGSSKADWDAFPESSRMKPVISWIGSSAARHRAIGSP
ncbi:hypothetical protein [Rhodanobacter lindaniclasticus]